MDEMNMPQPVAKVKIEKPTESDVSVVYGVLVFLSFCLIAFTLWILILEWTGSPLPIFLRLLFPL